MVDNRVIVQTGRKKRREEGETDLTGIVRKTPLPITCPPFFLKILPPICKNNNNLSLSNLTIISN